MKRETKKHRESRLAFKEAVLLREPTCRICGAPSVDAHHVLPKGRGGKDDPENGCGLCRRDHTWVHEHPREAREQGHLS